MLETVFKITKMDCPSEENLIRMKLDDIGSIKHLEFDIPNRNLTVYHEGYIELIEDSIADLKLGATLVSTSNSTRNIFNDESKQKKVLWAVLIINFSFFLLEMTTGIVSKSMGLVADSLDMLADSFVYILSLLAVGKVLSYKKRIAKMAGYFQITLAFIGFIEILRRFFELERLPNFNTMIIVSVLALIANSICLYLLQKSKNKEAHMQASMMFTSNDIIINLGVILAGLLVNWLNSRIPDLVIGVIVFILVIQGANRILKLSK